jgi:tetratricopeptide (TPR) repeat protein
MHLLPEALVERLKSRQAVLVTGLGCAESAGLASWPALCERMAEWIDDETAKRDVLALVHDDKLALAAALLRELVAADALVEVLADAYPASREVPEGIRALAQAPWRGIVAAGYDGLWATAFAEQGAKPERIAIGAAVAGLEPGRGRFLVQLFGRPDLPDSLCWAPNELRPKLVVPGAGEFVLGLHKKWSFVFVGFRPGDPDLGLIARLLGASSSTLDHYFVAPGLSDWEARQVRAEHGVIPVASEGSVSEVWQALAEACRLAGDKPPADNVEAWLERLAAEPADEEAREMIDQGVGALRGNQEWERLVAALITKVELEPSPKEQAADLHAAAKVLDQELSAPDRAFPVLMMALRLTPHDGELLTDAKRVAAAAGQATEFHAELAEIEKESAGAPEADQMSLGVARLLAEDPALHDEAVAAYRRVLDRSPDHALALAGLEALLRKTERWGELTQLLTKAVQRHPDDAELVAKLEEMFERTKQNTPLVELLSDRLSQKPDHQPTLAKLESLHHKKQDWTKLAALHKQALERNPDDADALAKLEEIYKQTQRWAELGALYEKQLAQHPGDATVQDKVEDL